MFSDGVTETVNTSDEVGEKRPVACANQNLAFLPGNARPDLRRCANSSDDGPG